MRRNPTPALLADVAAEWTHFTVEPGANPTSAVRYQPGGIRVDNDGCWTHWMLPGEYYTLAHDGTGWRVTCPTWDNHVRRLAHVSGPHGTWATALPLAGGGEVELDTATVYQLHVDHEHRMTLSALS